MYGTYCILWQLRRHLRICHKMQYVPYALSVMTPPIVPKAQSISVKLIFQTWDLCSAGGLNLAGLPAAEIGYSDVNLSRATMWVARLVVNYYQEFANL